MVMVQKEQQLQLVVTALEYQELKRQEVLLYLVFHKMDRKKVWELKQIPMAKQFVVSYSIIL